MRSSLAGVVEIPQCNAMTTVVVVVVVGAEFARVTVECVVVNGLVPVGAAGPDGWALMTTCS